MRRFGTPRPRDYTLVMTAYGRVDMWEEAVALLDEMRSCAYDPGVINFNCALAACERAGAWQAAMTILDGMKGSQICPDQLSFMAVLGAVSQQSFWQHGLQLLTDMECSSEAPDAMAYSAAMGACGRSKRWWVAVALLGKVKSSELIPDEVMYNTVISACEQSRRWQQALALLREVAPSKSAHEASQPQPEVDFLGMTAQDWAPLEEELQLKVAEEEQEDEGVEEAWQAFRKTYQLADLPKQEKRDGWDAAEQVLRGFEGIDQQILNVYIFSSTISACAKGQQVDLALELLDEMVYYKLRVSAIPLSAIASGCADVGRWQLALQLLGRSVPDVPLFNSVMWAVGKAHRWQQAVALLRNLETERLSPTTVTFNTLFSISLSAHHMWQPLARAMAASRCSPDSVTARLLQQAVQLRISPVALDAHELTSGAATMCITCICTTSCFQVHWVWVWVLKPAKPALMIAKTATLNAFAQRFRHI